MTAVAIRLGDAGDGVGRFLVDDEFFIHPKVVQVGPFGAYLYLGGLAYCNRLFTDGFIPGPAVTSLAPGVPQPMKLTPRLLQAGLWEEEIGGFRVHDYHDWNPTAEQRKAAKEAAQARKKAWKARHWNAVPDAFGTPTERLRNGGSSSSVQNRTDQGIKNQKASERQLRPSRPPAASAPPTRGEFTDGNTSSTEAAPPVFRVADEILAALGRCPRLGRVVRLREPTFWQAMIRAHDNVDFPKQIRKAEAWMVANPNRAPMRNFAEFLNRWFGNPLAQEER